MFFVWLTGLHLLTRHEFQINNTQLYHEHYYEASFSFALDPHLLKSDYRGLLPLFKHYGKLILEKSGKQFHFGCFFILVNVSLQITPLP